MLGIDCTLVLTGIPRKTHSRISGDGRMAAERDSTAVSAIHGGKAIRAAFDMGNTYVWVNIGSKKTDVLVFLSLGNIVTA
jgi:hypothetical protein